MNTSILFDTRHTSKVGFMSIFVYGHNIATQQDTVFEPMVIGDPANLIQSITELGLTETVKPIFCTENSRQMIDSNVYHMLRSGLLDMVPRTMLGCDCGKVKTPSDAKLYKTSTSLISDGRSVCCNSTLKEKEEFVIQTKPIKFLDRETESCPYWAKSEIENMKYNFRGKSLVLSRSNETKISVTWDDRHFFIDNDLFVYLSPIINEQIPINIVAGTSLVKQVTLSMYFMSLLRGEAVNPVLHFLPRVNYKGERDLQGLCDRFGSDRVRAKLLALAKSEKQVINFNDSGI